jgi:hypothetical protein
MTSDQIRAAANKYGKRQRIDYFIEILGGRLPSYVQRDFTKELSALRYCGKAMVFLSNCLENQGYRYIQSDTHRYIYKLEVCGYSYIGATKDPFARYVAHLMDSQTSSVILVAAAIDNGVVPRMEIIDITDEYSSKGIEGFWIR